MHQIDSVKESVDDVAAVDLTVVGNKVTVAWTAPAGIATPSYRVYKTVGGSGRLYGFMGETTDVNFVDDNITPDLSRTPPIAQSLLTAAGDYPGIQFVKRLRVLVKTYAGSLRAHPAVATIMAPRGWINGYSLKPAGGWNKKSKLARVSARTCSPP